SSGAVAFGAASLRGAAPAGPLEVGAHDIDANFRGGWHVCGAPLHKVGEGVWLAHIRARVHTALYAKPACLLDTIPRPPHRPITAPTTDRVVSQAMADLDGDGIPEIAFQSAFAMQAVNSAGDNWIAHANGDPRQPWTVRKIDTFATSHHIAWADLDGDGKKELLNAPLIGEKSLAPTYDQDKASVFWYSPTDWKRNAVTPEIPA